ncbi:septum formation family protein [Petropleomorpha daqingensis]|uniref:Septum formation-related domain-containing protein n=1 Tax=Petropleomorpha daqingensis TaxID=2026353 RepID=A0A853CJS0_9ACTN|nr:septum formation family protein [Petropleomorpha daqingensis]NYJ08175.1 hypothetical protein [Petropleomorpha daqingensis]
MARWVVGLVALAAGVLVAGCATTVVGEASPASRSGGDAVAEPEIGTCRLITEDQTDDPRNPPEAVDCAQEHNAETAEVDDTGLGEDDAYPTEADLEVEDGIVAGALEDVCTFDLLTQYLGGDDLDEPYAFFAPYLPTEAEWAAGARWVRCDVFYGYFRPETTPGPLAGALAGADAAAYRSCYFGTPITWDVGPCSKPHDAEPIGASADVPDGTPYPADQAARQALATQCADDAGAYLGRSVSSDYLVDVYVGSAADWQSGPIAECVLVPAAGGRTSTSARD